MIGHTGRIAKFGVSYLLHVPETKLFLNRSTECPLPPLSSLLENERIRDTDSFVICIQIHSPVGPFFPQQPSAAYVPKELLDGLEALLDNASKSATMYAPSRLMRGCRYGGCSVCLS